MNEDIIQQIMEQTGLSRNEINNYVITKKNEILGITEYGALMIMCKELCVDSMASVA